MRQSERDALEQIQAQIQALLAGEAPATPTAAPRAPRRAAPTPAEPGDVHGIWDEDEKGFGCNVCGEGPFKVGEFAAHLFEDHDVPLAEANIEGLTHGRKWQMKKYLEKQGLKGALKGYGRKGAAAAAKPKPKWKKREKAREEEEPEEEKPKTRSWKRKAEKTRL